jgi:dTDP-4-amino-4,6-dideoxygalactose transaminase
VTAGFEDRFSTYTGLKSAVALSSCTAALHLSLLALGIGPGDEVITTPMTFIATVTSILHAGARPVFADVEPETGLMDMDLVERAVTPKTKAILPVHLYGSMVDMRSLKRIADKYNLKIIEDCAHCIEGERDGVRPGHLGDVACYSFYATKNLTCGEGGAIATNDTALAEMVAMLRNHGMTKDAATRYTDRYQHWDMISLGWKYNMNDIHASLLTHQLDRLPGYSKRRKEIWEIYDRELKGVRKIALPESGGESARHLYTAWVPPRERDRILHRMGDRGIGVAVNYRAVHTLTYFKNLFGFLPDDFPAARRIGDRTISLPLYPRLKDEEALYVASCLKEILEDLP